MTIPELFTSIFPFTWEWLNFIRNQYSSEVSLRTRISTVTRTVPVVEPWRDKISLKYFYAVHRRFMISLLQDIFLRERVQCERAWTSTECESSREAGAKKLARCAHKLTLYWRRELSYVNFIRNSEETQKLTRTTSASRSCSKFKVQFSTLKTHLFPLPQNKKKESKNCWFT